MTGTRPTTEPSDGHALRVERIIAAPATAIFDAFIDLYDRQRPDWVTDAQLDLRVGGHWSVAFQVPNGPAFREERIITALERPQHLAYATRIVQADGTGFDAAVELTIVPGPEGQRVQLAQQGFPTTARRDEFAAAWPDVLDEVARRVAAR